MHENLVSAKGLPTERLHASKVSVAPELRDTAHDPDSWESEVNIIKQKKKNIRQNGSDMCAMWGHVFDVGRGVKEAWWHPLTTVVF